MPRSLAYEPASALNAICPYFTMFPVEYPLRVLKKHLKDNPIIMDPFCGRGTTLFAARKYNLLSRGIDSSPIAIAISKAKLCNINTSKVLHLAQNFMDEGDLGDIPDSEFFNMAFNQSVLREICFIRQGLLKIKRETDTTVLLRAAMLGCLHGPMSKRPEFQAYFSNQMPRTYSTKPDYSVRYWRDRELVARSVEVLSVLKNKLSRLKYSDLPPSGTISKVILGDSRYAKSLPNQNRDFSIVVTSPPYYGMKTYLEDQWLRNWFLGGPSSIIYGNNNQLQHNNKETFVESLGSVWKNMSRTNAEDLHMYIRFGTIPSVKTDPKVLLRESLEASNVPWRVISTQPAASASSGKRQANLMSITSAATLEYDFHVERT